jgi:hypothetical protein
MSSRSHRSSSQDLCAFELKVIADFLAAAAKDYVDYSCNDYLAPATEENRLVFEEALRHHGATGDVLDESRAGLITKNAAAQNKVFIWDFALMAYLAHRAGLAQCALSGGRETEQLSAAERMLTSNVLDMLANNEYKRYESEPGCEDFTWDAGPAVKAYLAAVLEHAGRAGWQERVHELMASEGIVSVFAVDMVRWLSRRCQHAVELPALVELGTSADNDGAVARLGTSKDWSSEKLALKRATELDHEWVSAYQKNDADLATYAAGGNPFREYFDPDVPSKPPFASEVKNLLLTASRKHQRNAVVALFGQDAPLDALGEMSKQVSYQYWGGQIEVHHFGRTFPENMISTLASCLHLGHLAQARSLALLLCGAYEGKVDTWEGASPLCRWIASIACDYWNLSMRTADSTAAVPSLIDGLKEPVLIELYRHWRDPDLRPFRSHLLWLCDFHTHAMTDARVPVFVLAWLRLREAAGLRNPSIDHPLTKPGYAQLPPSREMYSDSTLEAVISRLRQDELAQLGDLDLRTPPQPPKPVPQTWSLIPEEVRATETIDVGRLRNFNVHSLRIPTGWVDLRLPEMLRFRDPATQAEFTVSAYRNPGLSYIAWADLRLPAFAAAHAGLRRAGARYPVDGSGWWGWAEEFDGAASGGGPPLHYLVVCFKNKLSLLSVMVKSTPEAFFRSEALYRMLIEHQIGLSDVDYENNFIHRRMHGLHQDLWPERQDIPGLKRLAVSNDLVDDKVLLSRGTEWYFGKGNTPEEKLASRDRAYAAEWFERAGELGNATAQFNLSVVLSNADGVPRDEARALMWCRKAAAQGHDKAIALLPKLAGRTSSL